MPKTEKWGFGEAKLVPPSTTDTTEIVVVLSDIHFPYQDNNAVKSALSLVRRLKPHRVVLNGDINDFFQLSRFNDKQERMETLQEEIDDANAFRQKVRNLAPNAVIDETVGNHDSRIVDFVAKNAKQLSTLRALQPSELFQYDELGFNWHPGCGFLLRPHFIVKHGTIVRKDTGASAKAELDQAGISGVSGHVHRLSTYKKSGYVTRQWTEGGGLMRLDPDYVPSGKPNWNQGCVVIEASTVSDAFLVHEVPFLEGKLHLGMTKY